VGRQFTEQGYQAMGKAALAVQWLQDDIDTLSSNIQTSQRQVLLETLAIHQDHVKMNELLKEMLNYVHVKSFSTRASYSLYFI
jgi:hypothetical protein